MQTSLTRLTADDGMRLVVHIWLPEWLIDGSLLVADAPEAGAPARTPAATRPQIPGAARPRGIIVIAHGMEGRGRHGYRAGRSPAGLARCAGLPHGPLLGLLPGSRPGRAPRR